MPTMDSKGLALLRSFEGCVLYAYDDANDKRIEPGDAIKGTLTIGFGHTGPDVVPGMTITQEQADALLMRDLERFEEGVNNAVTHDLTPNQFSALVDFAYNEGLEALESSTLLAMVNGGDMVGALEQFGPWDIADGRVSAGLVRRRAAEAALFGSP